MSTETDAPDADFSPVQSELEPPRIPAGKKCIMENGVRKGWTVSQSKSRDRGGKERGGYEYYRHGNQHIAHHRLLAYGWGWIETPFQNDVEIDHGPIVLRDLNVEWNLRPVTGKENTNLAVQRNKAKEAGQIQLGLDGDPI